MWYDVENGNAVRPADVDSTSSREYVYVRRNIVFVEESNDGEEVRPAHYRWDELKIPKDVWPVYSKEMDHDAALDDVYASLTELAEMIVEG